MKAEVTNLPELKIRKDVENSDLFELSYEAVGELDSSLKIVTDWTEENRLGVVYYLSESRVRGVLCGISGER